MITHRKTLNIASLICFIICILLWVPNIFFHISSPLWFLVFVFGPIGVGLAVLAKNWILIILNIVATLSFFIVMYLGYQFYKP